MPVFFHEFALCVPKDVEKSPIWGGGALTLTALLAVEYFHSGLGVTGWDNIYSAATVA